MAWARHFADWEDKRAVCRHDWEQLECVRRLPLMEFPGTTGNLDAPLLGRLEVQGQEKYKVHSGLKIGRRWLFLSTGGALSGEAGNRLALPLPGLSRVFYPRMASGSSPFSMQNVR